VLLARGVEREQVAAGVLEGHVLAVILAGDPLDDLVRPVGRRPLAHRERDGVGARIARVLEQLAHEDPRVGPIAIGLQPRPLAERPGLLRDGLTGTFGHGGKHSAPLPTATRHPGPSHVHPPDLVPNLRSMTAVWPGPVPRLWLAR